MSNGQRDEQALAPHEQSTRQEDSRRGVVKRVSLAVVVGVAGQVGREMGKKLAPYIFGDES